MVEFNERHVENLEGLLFTGELSTSLDYAGHNFVIRTLRSEDMYNIGKLISAYKGTTAETLAYKVAALALSIESVDGLPIAEAITTDDVVSVYAKFNKISKWYPVVVDRLFTEYIKLEAQAKEIADKLGES